MKCEKRRVAAAAFLLFWVVLGVGTTTLYLWKVNHWTEKPFANGENFVLSENEPEYTYEPVPFNVTEIEIALVTTNDTPITITVSNSTHSKLVLRNVSNLRFIPVSLDPAPREFITITFSRTNQTAAVSIIIVIHQLVQPSLGPVFYLIPGILLICVCGVFWLGSYLTQSELHCFGQSNGPRRFDTNLNRIGPIAIIILVVISGTLFSPLLSDVLANRYATERVEVTLDRIEEIGTLNESNTIECYNFTDIVAPYNASVMRVHVHTFEFGEHALEVEAEIDEEYIEFIIDGASSQSNWWLNPYADSEPCLLRLKRIDTDVQFSFVIDIFAIEEVAIREPTVPIILAFCGGFFFVVSNDRALAIREILKEKPAQEENPFD